MLAPRACAATFIGLNELLSFDEKIEPPLPESECIELLLGEDWKGFGP